jgi:molybdate-binding protein/predicted nucleic acid-binding protein
MTLETPVRFLLDTDYCLALIRRQPAHLEAVFDRFTPGEIGLSSLTVAALQERVQKSRSPERNRRALEQFLLPLAIVDFDTAAAAVLGRIASALTPQELGPDSHALLLAAHALSLNAILITPYPERYAHAANLAVNSGAGAALALLGDSPELSSRDVSSEPAGTIYAFGSHDVTLDLLGDQLHSRHPALTLVSAHVGSLGGLLALQQRQAHLAGAHLLDEETGDYNVSFVQRLLTSVGLHVVLLAFVTRVQGLLVQRGNPKAIGDLRDLTRHDVTFVNRQAGAGTRVLLDHHLTRANLDRVAIAGYEREESSHLGVATAVASGVADCGLGIQAAAHAHDLDFVPLFEERYDLIIPTEYADSPLLAPMLAMLRHPPADFLRRVEILGGYGTARMGEVIAEL